MSIHHVTAAIRKLLESSLVEPEIWADEREETGLPADSPTDVYVGPPEPDKALDKLILFLMRITPTPELRNADRVRKDPRTPNEPPKLFEPAVPLDLHYLVTSGPPSAGVVTPAPHDYSLIRLARAIRSIEAASPIALPLYHQEAIRLSLDPMSTEELSRIWAMFPSANCRTSFVFRASPVWIDPVTPRSVGEPVIDRDLRGGTLREPLQ